MEIKKPSEDEELKPLQEKKYLVKKIFRRYAKEEPVAKLSKRLLYIEFPKRTKQIFEETKIFVYKNKNNIILSVLFLLIIFFVVLLLLPKLPSADFIDRLDGSYIKGYVYFDNNYTGSTSGENFKNIPKEYCNDKHIIRLESEKGAYEWETYPIDCKSKKIIFYIEHEKALPSKNIIFNFLDSTGSFYISGKLYFDNNYIGYVAKEISVTREQCSNISKVKLELKDAYGEWDNNKEACNTSQEIQFKIA